MKQKFYVLLLAVGLLGSCGEGRPEGSQDTTVEQDSFQYKVEEFADIQILRYQIPGWEDLSLKEQKLVYYLTEAGLEGRDIIWDQNFRHNLKIRQALETIYQNYDGDRNTEQWIAFETYLKRLWFANGIHHHYSNDKFKPGFDREYLDELLNSTGAVLEGAAIEVIFNEKAVKKVNLDDTKGLVEGSAVNFYGDGITADEVQAFYAAKSSPDPERPLAHGLNSKVVRENGELVEQVWKSGGMYGEAIDEVVGWLEKLWK